MTGRLLENIANGKATQSEEVKEEDPFGRFLAVL